MFLLLLLQNRVISRVWIVQEPCEATKLSLPLAHPYLLWSAAVIFSTVRRSQLCQDYGKSHRQRHVLSCP